MSLKARIEAVIYAAEEPVTLAQLTSLFGGELREENEPAPEILVETGIIESTGAAEDDALAAEAVFTDAVPEKDGVPEKSEDSQKRAARQQDRELREKMRRIVGELIADYASGDRGMEIREIAGGYRIATKPEYHDAVRAFVKSLKPPMKLSLQALETLAVIAYKQPITAPELAEIRGVDSAGVLGGLVSRKLITTAGRKQVIGRPILYKTTKEFLLRFGLKDLGELPSIEEFEKMAAEVDFPEENIVGQPPEEPVAGFDREVAGAAQSEAIEANAGETGIAVGSEDANELQGESESDPVIEVLQAPVQETTGSSQAEHISGRAESE